LVPAKAERRAPQKMKNSGNEAKKYLKTKDITFLHAAICAHFQHIFAPIEQQKEQKTAHSAQMKLGISGQLGEVKTVTRSRLHRFSIFQFPFSGLVRA